MRPYEVVYILDASLGQDVVAEKIGGFHAVLGDETAAVDHWGVRRLAYPIGKARMGYYAVAHVTASPSALPEFERQLKLDEQVLRYLVVLNDGQPASGDSIFAAGAPAATDAKTDESAAGESPGDAAPSDAAPGDRAVASKMDVAAAAADAESVGPVAEAGEGGAADENPGAADGATTAAGESAADGADGAAAGDAAAGATGDGAEAAGADSGDAAGVDVAGAAAAAAGTDSAGTAGADANDATGAAGATTEDAATGDAAAEPAQPASGPPEFTGARGRSRRHDAPRVLLLNYKDVATLSHFISEQGKILPKRTTKVTARFQRELGTAVKRARYLALLPYVRDHES